MRLLDWAVLAATIAAIVGFGVWRAREVRTVDGYLRGRGQRWWTVGLSVAATQASAITFLSLPGQAYQDGLGFLQFYFGLPIAMVLLSATIVPLYYKLKVYTAYEYLEARFDRKTRQLTALLFLVSRGMAAGLSIYAPAIIVSTVMGWPIGITNVAIGALTIAYTVSGGNRAVARTQTAQMAIILAGMGLAFAYVLTRLHQNNLSFGDAMAVAGALGKVNPVDLSARFDQRYTLWSGLTGGLFVALAYFGTDQSQVQRYLSGATLRESRLGLLMNGLLKVPMQLGVLLVGLMVLVFYHVQPPPLSFREADLQRTAAGPRAVEVQALQAAHGRAFAAARRDLDDLVRARQTNDALASNSAKAALRADEAALASLREQAQKLIAREVPGSDGKDADYVFITFVVRHFPAGLLGLLLAVIFCAAMSASAAALSALGTTSVVDFYRPSIRRAASDAHYLAAARWFTVGWGALAVGFAGFAALLDNLIQAVNIVGSLFYGPMLGVFLVGFFLRRVGGTAVFAATLAAQAAVIAVAALTRVGFLWYNVVGCAAVVVGALALTLLSRGGRASGNVRA